MKNDTTVDEKGLTRLDKHKQTIRAYEQTPEGRVVKRRANKKWYHSDRGKQVTKTYRILSRPSGYE